MAGVLAATAARSARPPRRALRQAVALAPAGRRVACLRALSGCARGRATARPFCGSAGGFRAVGLRPRALPSSAALARAPRKRGTPPPCRACGRGCARPPRPSGSLRASLRPCPLWSRSPRLWLPCGRLRLWSRSRRVFGSPRRGLPAARAGALVWLVRGALPRRGLSRRFAALGGLRSSPPPGYGVYVPASIGPWLATVAPLRWDA